MGAAALPIMAIGGLVSAGSNIYSGIKQSEAIEQQAAFQAKQYEANARLAEIKAGDAISQGENDAKEVSRFGEKVKAAQRVGFAAQNVKIDSGSAKAVQDETDFMAQQDVERVKNNAWREAWGYKVEAANGLAQAGFTRQAGANASRNTLISAGLNAGSSLFKTYGDMYQAGVFKVKAPETPEAKAK